MSIFSSLYKQQAGYRYSIPVEQNLIVNNKYDVESLEIDPRSIGSVSPKRVSLFDELSDIELSERACRAYLDFE